ncbi:MAG: hypothetical protein K0U52_13455 [Gammaproteobacteria bacterium]|nr:hypothetical protein [Gammaproteobacteria bacterium]
MKTTINAIKTLIKARNKKYSEAVRLNIEERISWNDRPMLVITGFEASAYFAQMKPFLEPMICQVNIKEEQEVELQFNNN